MKPTRLTLIMFLTWPLWSLIICRTERQAHMENLNLKRWPHCTDTMHNGTKTLLNLHCKSKYRGSPTYTVFTTLDPTTSVFGLFTCKWGIFALVGDPQCKFCKTLFVSSPKIGVRQGPSVCSNMFIRSEFWHNWAVNAQQCFGCMWYHQSYGIKSTP